jgi:hypothetical protein
VIEQRGGGSGTPALFMNLSGTSGLPAGNEQARGSVTITAA